MSVDSFATRRQLARQRHVRYTYFSLPKLGERFDLSPACPTR